MINPNRESLIEINRQGLLRQRIQVSTRFYPLLTKRQREVLKGKPRMSRAWVRMLKIMEETPMTMDEFVQQLSAEELARGQIKNKDGTFGGRPPQWVPRAFHRACISELMRRGKQLWQENYLQAIETMSEIASGRGTGVHATPGERIKAAMFVIERLEGKVPERLIVTDEQPWMTVMDGIVAEVSDEAVQRGQKALNSAQESRDQLEEILDAELVDDDEEPPPARRRSRRTR